MTVLLTDIMECLEKAELFGDGGIPVTGVTHDSRAVSQGMLFVAMAGGATDGHDYIAQAAAAGAAAILGERPKPEICACVPYIWCPDARAQLGHIASLVYGRPTEHMTLVGITGTNGKTTLTYLLESILTEAGHSPGVVGTISYRWCGSETPALHTTPEASDLQRILAEMRRRGVTHVVMEVSSHGLHQGRLTGCLFDVGVFTNLTQDHLDYHGGLEEYYLAKKILFTEFLPHSGTKRPWAVINHDDLYGLRLESEIQDVAIVRYGSDPQCEVHPKDTKVTPAGIWGSIETPGKTVTIQSHLTGSFNLSNILAAVAVSHAMGIDAASVTRGIAGVYAVPGRLEKVSSERGSIFVDYAHTPHAVRNVLEALGLIRVGRLVTIIGCGGDRDKTKRPLMGLEAAKGSDFVIVTSDNPRSEDPLEIIRQVEEGVRAGELKLQECETDYAELLPGQYVIIPDRRQAIAVAVRLVQPGDILLVAGKGHETYQEINGVRHPFDDRQVIREELRCLKEELAAQSSCRNHPAAAGGTTR